MDKATQMKKDAETVEFKQETAVAVVSESEVGIFGETAGQKFYSGKADSFEEKIALFNSTSAPEHRISDEVNMPITIKDVYMEAVICVNDKTGEMNEAPRCVIIDDKGEGHTACSKGIYSSLRSILLMCGMPSTWKRPIVVIPKNTTKGEKKYLSLTIQK